MRLTLEEYRLILENAPNLVWRSGKDGQCNYFNKTWLEFTGRTMEEELGDGWAEGVHPDDLDYCIDIYTTAFENREPFEMNYRLRRSDGEYRIINDRGVPYYSNGEFLGYIGSCIDVTEKVEGELLRDMAIKDGLTGVYDRQYFNQLLKEKIIHAVEYEIELSVMMIDIDDFKEINDTYGHKAGDQVLKKVVEIINNSIRSDDVAGRYGGDEFLVFLPKAPIENAENVAKRICDNLEKSEIMVDGNKIKVTLSIGLVPLRDEKNIDQIISKADQAMYKAKEKMGNNIVTNN